MQRVLFWFEQEPHSLRFFSRANRGCPYSGSRVGGSDRAELGCGGMREAAPRTVVVPGSTTELAVSSSSEALPVSAAWNGVAAPLRTCGHRHDAGCSSRIRAQAGRRASAGMGHRAGGIAEQRHTHQPRNMKQRASASSGRTALWCTREIARD